MSNDCMILVPSRLDMWDMVYKWFAGKRQESGEALRHGNMA